MQKLIALAVLLLALPATAPAQGLRSLEATVGPVFGRGGSFDTRNGFGLDALVSAGIRPAGGGTIVGAISAGVTAMPGADRCLLLPDGSCTPDFPFLTPFAALLGWEAPDGMARLSAGPALVVTDANDRKGSTGGMMGRVDVSSPAPFHLAFVLSARALVVPAYHGRAIAQLSMGVGVAIR